MKWITRERVRVDRVSSAWLILRFVVGGVVGEFLALVPLGYLLVRLFRRSSPLSPEQAETDDAETGEDEETRKLRKFGLL